VNRRTILALVAVVAVLSAAVGWYGGQRIKSPAEVAAETEPPPASLITVPVEERSLTTSVVIRGQVEFEDAAEIPVNPSPTGATIITQVHKAPGDDLNEGDAVIEVAGRPLFVMEGELPVFRSLGPGVEGPDVQQLEEALVRLGYSPGAVDEVYDNGTEEAVVAFYRAAGYRPDEPTTEEVDQLELGRQRVRLAGESLRSARSTADVGDLPESVRLELNMSVEQAEHQLDDAKRLQGELVTAATGERDTTAAAEVTALEAADTATARLNQALAGVHPDTGLDPTDDEIATLRSVDEVADGAWTTATAAAVSAASALVEVERDRSRSVDDLTTGLAISKARRSETIAQFTADTGAAEAVRAAEKELVDAESALVKLDARIGTSFPGNELYFLPKLPRVVQQVNVKTGDFPQGPAMTVTGSGLLIRSSVSAADRPLVRAGVEGVMDDSNLGISVRVTVAFVADSPGGPNAGTDRYAVRLEPIDEIPEEALNQNLRVTLPFESTEGAVLAVPLAALSAGADGTSRVQVERPDGTVETLTVTTGLLARALGLVEIVPEEGELQVGDRVVVGRDAGGPVDDQDVDPDDDDLTGDAGGVVAIAES